MSALAWVTGSGSSRFTPGLPRLQHLKVCSWHSPPKKDKKRGLEKKATFFNETTFSSFFFLRGVGVYIQIASNCSYTVLHSA